MPTAKDIIFDIPEILREQIIPHYKLTGDVDIALSTLVLVLYNPPFEDGYNIGEISFTYNKVGHKAVWGLYADGSVKCFMD